VPADPDRDHDALIPRRRRFWRRVVPLTATILALLAVEGTQRLLAARQEQRTWSFRIEDELRGWALRPGFRGAVTDENDVWLEINSDGMRDREHPRQPPPSTVRVAILGDSYMQAQNLPFEKSLPPKLEQHLQRCVSGRGRRAEVLNFGVSGYGTGQQLLTFQHHAIRYRPDVVVLAFYTDNDVYNNHPDTNESFTNNLPYFVLENGALVLRTVGDADEEDRDALPWYHRVRLVVTDHLLIARSAWNAYALLRAPFVPLQVVDVDRPHAQKDSIYVSPQHRATQEAWAVTEALILELARQVRLAGAELWIVTLTNAPQVHPDPDVRRRLARDLGVDDLLYPDRRIAALGRANGVPVITLAEPLMAYTAEHQVYLNGGYNERYPFGTGHWNETAHTLAAGLVGDRLCADSRAITTR
jgi:hypothetical protein